MFTTLNTCFFILALIYTLSGQLYLNPKIQNNNSNKRYKKPVLIKHHGLHCSFVLIVIDTNLIDYCTCFQERSPTMPNQTEIIVTKLNTLQKYDFNIKVTFCSVTIL